MQSTRFARICGLLLFAAAPLGCLTTPTLPKDTVRGTRVATADFGDGPAPLRTPSPAQEIGSDRFEDSLTGGEVFQMYCAQCHNRRPMSERPFANYRNVAAHMRTRANLSGKEYEKLVAWMRRVQDASPPGPDTEPSPKRLTFSQPLPKPRDEAGAAAGANPDGPNPDGPPPIPGGADPLQ
jgi:hypothetical protein